MFLLEAEDSGLLLNVDLLQVLPHLHHLAQKKHNATKLSVDILYVMILPLHILA